MSLNAATIRAMRAAGLTDTQILDVVEKAAEARAEKVRAANRDRQARHRARNASNADNACHADNTVTAVTTVTEPEPSRACSNTNLPTEDISLEPPLPPKGGDGRKAEPRNRGHRLPLDWQPDANLIEFARSLGFSTDQEREARAEFVDYWLGVPGSRGCKTDWPATYRNRLREVAAKRKLKPAANVLPFGGTGPPPKPMSEAEMRERALDFDRRWKAGEFR